MSNSYRKGQRVRWNWGTGTGRGKVAESFDHPIERTIEGTKITRNGCADNPAYLVRPDEGGEVLKLGSELSRA
jgi:hypothetical protein